MTTGEKISELMRRGGYSRDQMATYLGIHKNTFKGYLADDRLPDSKSMYLMAILFEVSIEELLDTKDMLYDVIDAKIRMDKWLENNRA